MDGSESGTGHAGRPDQPQPEAPSPVDTAYVAALADQGTVARPPDAVDPLAGADLARRRFFRQFATEAFHTAATVVGAATALQRGTAEAASAILSGTTARADEGVRVPADPRFPAVAESASGGGVPVVAVSGGAVAVSTFGRPRAAIGYHSAFRLEGDRIVLINQRRLPFALVDVDCRTAVDIANEIGQRTIVGGPAIAQAAALGLAFTANRLRSSRPYARRAILRAAEATLLQARRTSPALRRALERVMARYQAIGEFDDDGDRIAAAIQDEADAIVSEANDDHGRLAEAAATRIPRRDDGPVRILTLGSTGAMAGGQFGTAFGAIQAVTYADRDVHVHVLEGRPNLDGARVTIWELAQAGIPHTLITDAAAGWLLQGGRIDVVLVGAEAIALNGDLANDAGTYPVAALAGRHGIPFIVCAPLATVDPAAPDGRALVNDERPRDEVVELAKMALTLADTPAANPAVDITPADLVTAIATEEGVIEGPFGRELQAALARRAARLPRVGA